MRKPAVISSKSSTEPFFVAISRAPSRKPGMRPAPRTGSITMAASLFPRASTIFRSASRSP
jgi:hypothetical protein